MTTFWMSFCDPDATGDKFRGVVILDMDDEQSSVGDAASRAWELGINPGGEIAAYEVPADIVEERYKNKLITDTQLLSKLGGARDSRSRYA
jgi:hypothetical protein